jgi:hypothetical protein
MLTNNNINNNNIKLLYNRIDHISLSVILYIVPIYIYFIKQYYLLSILGGISTVTSFLYHITYEQSILYLYLDALSAYSSFIVLFYDILFFTSNIIEFYMYMSILSFACISYLLGTGRNKTIERSNYYNIFHFMWHILIFILTLSHSYLK